MQSSNGNQVVWEPPDPGEWELEAAHVTSLPAPLGQGLMTRAFAEGSSAGSAPLGLPLSHMELRFVNGWPYVSFFMHDVPRKGGKPPPDIVLKAVTRLHPGFRRRTKIAQTAVDQRLPQQAAQAWLDERGTWIDRLLQLQRTSLASLTDEQLAAHLVTVFDTAESGMRRHFELIFISIPLGRWLRRGEGWGLDRALVRSAVMHGTPVHDDARRRLDRVVEVLGDERPASLDDVRAVSAECAAALDDYLDHHGGWATSDAVDGTVLTDHPEAILAAIRARAEATSDPSERREELVAQLRGQVPTEQRTEFDQLVDDAHVAYRALDDNSGILGAWPLGILNTTVRHAADRLVADGRLESAGDVWVLEIDEVAEILRASNGSAPDALSSEHVAERVTAWRALADLDPPRFLGSEPGEPPDVGVFPKPVAHLMGGLFAFIEDKFNNEHTTLGVGDTPARGRAVVVDDPSTALDRLEPGDILVTVATSPAYNTVLGIAGGVVVSSGGPSCHTAVVARELGIPAIVGYPDATTTIEDGSVIEIDPVAATVNVLA